MVVPAVGGRSPNALEIAAFEEGGNFPVSSSCRILAFISSSSSQTVDAAVVETVDSVPSSCCAWSAKGGEAYLLRFERCERFEDLEACRANPGDVACIDFRLPMALCDSGECCCIGELNDAFSVIFLCRMRERSSIGCADAA